MEKNSYILDREQQRSALIIGIENTVSEVDRLKFVVTILRRRFNIDVVLAFKAPELFFFNRRVLRWVSEAEIDRIFITGNPDLFWPDCIEFAKRQEADSIFFAELPRLTSTWTNLIKFRIETLDTDFTVQRTRTGEYFAVSKSFIRSHVTGNPKSFEGLYWSLLTDRETDSIAYHSNKQQNLSLFVSRRGVERFGGISKFKTLNISFDSYKPDEHKRLWQIDNDLDLEEFCAQDTESLRHEKLITIPGVLRTKGDVQLLVDINPAHTGKIDQSFDIPDLPRTILSVTPWRSGTLRESGLNAVFIMSNYNKESYVASALYSIAMQTHGNCLVHLVDDISTDHSLDVVTAFTTLIDSSGFQINVELNEKNTGTYWIRNSIIQKYIDTGAIYLVNDSDDYSSTQRAAIQVSLLDKEKRDFSICFGDIIRVDNHFRILILDGKAERYGTASLSAPCDIHRHYGYYENIRKNADTEFIERLRHFGGKNTTRWFRYPILFQPFDGTNLTADIYSRDQSSGALKADLGWRIKHRALFTETHQSIRGNLADHFRYPDYRINSKYTTEIPEILI